MPIKPPIAVTILKAMWALPEVELSIYGTDDAETIFNYFTKPHPRYKVLQNKKWGVALMPVPDNEDEYLKGKPKQVVRTNRTRCLKRGYYFKTFNPMERITEIMDIHLSAHFRQGRSMSEDYLNENKVLRWVSDKPLLCGIFNSDDMLKAYTYVPVIGELCLISRLLGHDEALNDGVMYLLISEMVNQMVNMKHI